jgi:hypothetical protein
MFFFINSGSYFETLAKIFPTIQRKNVGSKRPSKQAFSILRQHAYPDLLLHDIGAFISFPSL